MAAPSALVNPASAALDAAFLCPRPQGAGGLVHSSTSDTAILLDPVLGRLRRMRKGVINSARLVDAIWRRGGQRVKPAMVTLTYAEVDSWDARDVTRFLKCAREWLARRGHPFRYVWVLELQQRGAPHYHCLIWLPRGLTMPKPDKRGWWSKGMTKIEWARRPVGYLAKYASKMLRTGESCSTTLRFPVGARLHGSGGLDSTSKMDRRWWCAPLWLRQQTTIESDVHPVVGGGWLSRASGQWFQSPWCVYFKGGGLVLVPRPVSSPAVPSFAL